MNNQLAPKAIAGFTLVELAMVLLIVAFLVGGLMMPLTAQIDSRNMSDTRRALSEIREALLGFATIHRRLPCPADKAITDPSDPKYGQEECTKTTEEGWLPWKTLGLSEIDPWGQRRSAASDAFVGFWHYRVDTAFADQTSPVSMDTSPTQLSLVDNAGNSLNTASQRPIVIVFSTGPNQRADGENGGTVDAIYQAGERTPNFDDATIWISRPILVSRLIAAGRLP